MKTILLFLVLFAINMYSAYVIGFLKSRIKIGERLSKLMKDYEAEPQGEERVQKFVNGMFDAYLDRSDLPTGVKYMDKVVDFFKRKPKEEKE